MNRELTPGVQRMLERLGDLPVLVCDAAWEIIAKNQLGLGAARRRRRQHGAVRHFLGPPRARSCARPRRTPAVRGRDRRRPARRARPLPGRRAAARADRRPAAREPALRGPLEAAPRRARTTRRARRSTIPTLGRHHRRLRRPDPARLGPADRRLQRAAGHARRRGARAPRRRGARASAVERVRVRPGALPAVQRLDPRHLLVGEARSRRRRCSARSARASATSGTRRCRAARASAARPGAGVLPCASASRRSPRSVEHRALRERAPRLGDDAAVGVLARSPAAAGTGAARSG